MYFMTTFWVSIDLVWIDSTLVQAHNPDMDLRLEKESENKTQRTPCLEELVGLALHKEELEKWIGCGQQPTHVPTVGPWVMGGWLDSVLRLHSFCRLKQQCLLFQMFTVSSAFAEVQMHWAGMHWVGVGLNVTSGLVMCKSIKWEYKCQAVLFTLESGCEKKRL